MVATKNSDPLVKARAKVAKAIVAGVEGRACFAFKGVLASGIERLVAHNAALIAVVAPRACRAKGQAQAIPKHEREMRVWARRWLFTFESDGRLEEAAGPRAARGAQIHTIILAKGGKKFLPRAGMQVLRPSSLLLGPRARQASNPIRAT